MSQVEVTGVSKLEVSRQSLPRTRRVEGSPFCPNSDQCRRAPNSFGLRVCSIVSGTDSQVSVGATLSNGIGVKTKKQAPRESLSNRS